MNLDSRVVTRDGIAYDIAVEYDHDSKPDDYDCYSDEDKTRWANDQWQFVGIRVWVQGFPDTEAALWGIEWGLLTEEGKWLDLDYYLADADTIPNLMDEARAELVKVRDKLNKMLEEEQ